MIDNNGLEPKELERKSSKSVDTNKKPASFDGYAFENILTRINANPSVLGYVKVKDGLAIHNTLETNSNAENLPVNLLTECVSKVVNMAHRVIKELDPLDELCFMRINSRKYELLISKNDEFLVIVVQLHNYTHRTSITRNC